MPARPTPCLYLTAPSDPDAAPWCGLSHPWPDHCRICGEYEATWALPDAWEITAWRRAQ